ncbi:hypothetical protein Ndes2526B_g08195 [Nannochloris sp. 'desiccata']|nr:hypothetical protein KSW81_001675 [Chlorella desiccata (nom. nud.)]KAH7616097.1 hypothetical protein NADE_000931 [Chlorella desiccata (nom. nud.)]
MVFFSLGVRSILKSGGARRHARGSKGTHLGGSTLRRVIANATAMAAPFKGCFPNAIHACPRASPPASSQAQSDAEAGSDCSFEDIPTSELIFLIQHSWENVQEVEKLKNQLSAPRTMQKPEQWAKERLYPLKDMVAGYRQVIFDAGLGDLLGEDVTLYAMDCDPMLNRVKACDGGSTGVVAADAPLRPNPCETGAAMMYDVSDEPYTSPATSGSKRKRSEVEEEGQQQEDGDCADCCKRLKRIEEPSLQVLLDYLKQCSKETLIFEFQKWERKEEEAVVECSVYKDAGTQVDARWGAVRGEYEAAVAEYNMLRAILKSNKLERLVDAAQSNLYDGYLFNDSEDGSVFLGMLVAEENEGKEEEISSPTVGADSDKATPDEYKENAAPFQKAVDFTQRMMAPFHNAQRVLKECNRRFQMRERSGETRW